MPFTIADSSMMGDLGDGVLGVLGSIPGVRRSLKPH